MGRGKKRQKAKLKKDRFSKISRGEPVYFTLANSPVKYRGFSNKYSYKTNIHNLIYKDANISNVNFRQSIITECNFRNTKLKGVDFIYTNLRGTNFDNAKLDNVIFFGANLEETSFKNVKFHNTFFISTNVGKPKNIDLNSPGLVLLKEYPSIKIGKKLEYNLDVLSRIDKIYNSHVLHVKRSKYNKWMLSILISFYGEQNVSRALYALKNRKDKRNFYTFYSFNKFISEYLKDDSNI